MKVDYVLGGYRATRNLSSIKNKKNYMPLELCATRTNSFNLVVTRQRK